MKKSVTFALAVYLMICQTIMCNAAEIEYPAAEHNAFVERIGL